MALQMKKMSFKEVLEIENPVTFKRVVVHHPQSGNLLRVLSLKNSLEERKEMLSQNQSGTISDEELGNAVGNFYDQFADMTFFETPLSDFEFYVIKEGPAPKKTREPKESKSFWSDVPEEVKKELTSDDWL